MKQSPNLLIYLLELQDFYVQLGNLVPAKFLCSCFRLMNMMAASLDYHLM